MVRVQRAGTALGSVALVTWLGAGVTACSDDSAVAAPSTAEFCVEMQQLSQDGDDAGPYAAFYDKHPEPTPADWAADGHLVTEAIQVTIDEIEGTHPSDEAKPLVDDVLAAFDVLKQNSVDTSKAGEDDDQAALDELEQVNQGTNVPALMASIQAVTDLCTTAAGS